MDTHQRGAQLVVTRATVTREFGVLDPDNNLISIYERIDTAGTPA